MPMLRTYAYSIRARLVALRARLWSCVFGWFERVTSVFDSTRESASEMTPAATSGVDCVLGGSELQPGAALYRCGPAIAQQKRHRPECGHTVKGARCYRLCAHSLVRQSEAATVGIRRSTVPPRHGCQHEPEGYALAANFASGSKKDGGHRRYHRGHNDIMSVSKPPRLLE